VSPLRKKSGKEPGKLGKAIALGGSVTLIPVLRSRFRKARAEGDRLNQLDVLVSAAALAVGAAKLLRRRRPAVEKDEG
jgi:hypothetical protein